VCGTYVPGIRILRAIAHFSHVWGAYVPKITNLRAIDFFFTFVGGLPPWDQNPYNT